MQTLKYITFSFLMLFLYHITQAQNTDSIPPKYSKAKIYFNTTTDLQRLSKNGVVIEGGLKKSKKYIESVFSATEIKTAKKLGFNVEILVDDMQKHILNRDKKKTAQKNAGPCNVSNEIIYNTPANFNLGTMGGFLTYAEVLQELDDMRALYPNLITARSAISTFTTTNNNTLQWVKISDNADTDEAEPEVLYDALHHAREPASMQQLIFYMWYLLENYATNTEVKAIVDNTELYFIPVVNPDGYIYNETTNPNGGGFWRKNRRNNGNGTFGVDNNRNYNYINTSGNSVWNTSGTSNDTSADNYAGTGPFSEIENQAMQWFVEQHHFTLALNNHTFGNLFLYPFSYQSIQTVDNTLFATISDEMVLQNNFNNILSADLYPAAGDADDFMYGETSNHDKIFSMTPEIGDSFWPAQSEIIPLCKRMVFANLTTAHLVNNFGKLSDITPAFLNAQAGNLNYTLKRLGLQGTSNFTVSIIPISTNISMGGANQHNSLTLFEEVTGSISYTLDASIAIGDTVTYKLILDNGLYTIEKEISKIYGTPQETLADNGDNLSNWTTSSWNTTTSTFFSSSSAITDSPSGNYADNQNSTIELSNNLDLTNVELATVSFYAKWNIEPGFDYVQFEISTDNGTTWQPQCGKLTKLGVPNQGITDQPMYDGVQNAWVKETIDLSDYVGQTIKARFQLVSDGGVTEDGFYFDDFKVNSIDTNVLGINTNVLSDIKIYPNPVREIVTIKMPNAQPARVKVYAITGQLVKQLETNTSVTEINVRTFNQGIYFIKLQTETGNAIFKIIKQ